MKFNPALIDDCYKKEDADCTTCPDLYAKKDCKCYRHSTDDAMDYDDVFCAFEEDGFIYACKEGCCNNGEGCIEPVRCSGDERVDPEYRAEKGECHSGVGQPKQDVTPSVQQPKKTKPEPTMLIIWIILGIFLFVVGPGLFFLTRKKQA